MTTICYYISDYGYGHATRSVALLRKLLMSNIDARIIICASNNVLPFIQASMSGRHRNQLVFRSTSSDLGYVLREGTIQIDIGLFREQYHDYICTLQMEIEREAAFISGARANLVISDISPVPIAAATLARVKSLGISNFTWYTGYEDLLDRELLRPLWDAYSQMDGFIPLAGAREPRWSKAIIQGNVGYYCRTPDQQEVARLINELNPGGDKTVVFFALGMSILASDMEALKIFKDEHYVFVVSSNMNMKGCNVHVISSDYTESQNYAAASDIILTKPGWGTVGEAVVFGKQLLLLDRHWMKEDKNTIHYLNGMYSHQALTWEMLKSMKAVDIFKTTVWSRRRPYGENSERQKQRVVKIIEQFIN